MFLVATEDALSEAVARKLRPGEGFANARSLLSGRKGQAT